MGVVAGRKAGMHLYSFAGFEVVAAAASSVVNADAVYVVAQPKCTRKK